MANYILLFQATDTIAVGSHLNSGETSFTLTGGNFGTPSGTQLYVVDYDIPGSAEIISASVATTSATGVTRGLSGGAAGTTNHAAGAKVASIFVPQHYAALVDGSGLTLASLPNNTILGNQLATTAITLGYAQSLTNFTTTTVTAFVDVTSLSTTVTIPAGGRRVKVTAFCESFKTTATAGTALSIAIYEGATQLASSDLSQYVTNSPQLGMCIASFTPTAGSHTYKVAVFQGAAGTLTVSGATTAPSFILVELI